MLLLDTCCLLWLASDQARFSTRAKELVAVHSDSLFLSAISGFEIAVKYEKGRLSLPMPPKEWIERAMDNHGVQEMPVTWRIAAHSARLPPLHADPCDRMIIATAQLHDLLVLTPDTLISAYPDVRVAW